MGNNLHGMDFDKDSNTIYFGDHNRQRFVDFLESLLKSRLYKRGFITVKDTVSEFERKLKYEIKKDIITLEDSPNAVRLQIDWFLRFEKADLIFIEGVKSRIVKSINLKSFDAEMVEFVVVTGSGL